MPFSPTIVRFLFLVPCSVAAGCASQEVELGLHLTEGQSFGVAFVATQDLVQEVGDDEIEMSRSIAYHWHEDVESVDADGNATVVRTYDAIFLVEDGSGGHVEYDSTRAGAKVPAAALGFDAAIGESLRLELSPRGEVRSVGGVDRMLDRMVAKMRLPDGVDAYAVRRGLEQEFGEEAVRERMQTLLGIYPDGPVREGDSWTRDAIVRTSFPHRQESVYELTDIDEKFVTIHVETRIRPLKDAPPVRSGMVEMRFFVEGTQEGRLVVDRATGVVMVGEIVQELEGTMTLTMPGRGSVTSPMKLEGKIELATTRLDS